MHHLQPRFELSCADLLLTSARRLVAWRAVCRNYNANKNLAFNANMTAVQQAIKNAMGHLDWLCDGQFTQQRRPG